MKKKQEYIDKLMRESFDDMRIDEGGSWSDLADKIPTTTSVSGASYTLVKVSKFMMWLIIPVLAAWWFGWREPAVQVEKQTNTGRVEILEKQDSLSVDSLSYAHDTIENELVTDSSDLDISTDAKPVTITHTDIPPIEPSQPSVQVEGISTDSTGQVGETADISNDTIEHVVVVRRVIIIDTLKQADTLHVKTDKNK